MSQALPLHLSQNEASGYASGETIAQFEIGTMKNFIYLILDHATKKAAIVDPQKDLTEPFQVLKEHGFQLEAVLLTHTHHDHIAGLGPLLERYPEIMVRVGGEDEHRLSDLMRSAPGLKILKDEEVFQVGSIAVKAIHTPGHSAGEFCYFLEKASSRPYLFTGDTIFIRDCGRTDFPDGSNEAMFQSIQRIKKLPKETVFLVGHHYAKECATTLGDELEKSPPF